MNYGNSNITKVEITVLQQFFSADCFILQCDFQLQCLEISSVLRCQTGIQRYLKFLLYYFQTQHKLIDLMNFVGGRQF